MGMSSRSTPSATIELTPSSRYSINMATRMRRGEEMRPMMFWHSSCSVSASEVTRLNTRPLVNSPLTAGEIKSTFLKVSCTSSARSWYPACAQCDVIARATDTCQFSGACRMLGRGV